MAFNTIRNIRERFDTKQNNIELCSTEVRLGDELFVLGVEGTTRDISELWEDNWFPNDTVATESESSVTTVYVGPSDAIPETATPIN